MKNKTSYMMILVVSILLVTLLHNLTFSQNQPKAWYVYKNATGLNNGTNWTNAWTSFSAIDWNAISSGDTLYLSGGNDSIIYYEQLVIQKNSLIIRSSNQNGHNGKVYLINDNSNIVIYGKSNVTVYGINLQNQNNEAIKIDNSTNIIIDNLNIMTSATGIFIQNSIDIIVRYCTIRTTTYSTNQTDGIYSQRNRRVKIHNNLIIISNSEPDGHNDCIQSYLDGRSQEYSNEETMMIWNNILFQNNYKLANSSATMMTYGWGWFTFYNNLIVQPYSYVVGLGVQQNIVSENSNMKARIWNNTFIVGINHDKPIYFRRMKETDTIDIVNNMIYTKNIYAKIKIDDSQDLNIARCDHNSYYSTENNWNLLVKKNTINFLISDWQNLSYDQNSLFINPQLVNPYFDIDTIGDFSLKSNSPLIDAGVNIKNEVLNLGLPWTDIRGFNRDQNPDIGAFEFFNVQNIDIIPPEVLSANIIDSITVNLTFSEPVEQSSATNPANYSIDNGIIVSSVQLLSSSVVRLNTSLHTPGFYTVIVNSVTDTAGNVINPSNNSAMYGYNPDPLPGLLKIIPTGTNASSIPEPEHLPEKTFDGLGYNSGDPSSRWAGTNLPQWIGYDLGDSKILNKIRIQFYKWNEGRIYNYSIMSSLDSVNWTYIKQNIYSTNTEWTEVTFDPVSAKYVRIVVHSNNQNNWASLWETEFYGQLMLSNEDDQSKMPENFVLEQNYPNPFNPTTKIRYSLPQNSDKKYQVSLQVYDLLGNEIAVLVNEEKEPGIYEVEFNAAELPSGVYIYRIEAAGLMESKKMLLLK